MRFDSICGDEYIGFAECSKDAMLFAYRVRYHHIWGSVKREKTNIDHVSFEQQNANTLTKPLSVGVYIHAPSEFLVNSRREN